MRGDSSRLLFDAVFSMMKKDELDGKLKPFWCYRLMVIICIEETVIKALKNNYDKITKQ